jgi:chemotaxis protein methyltransferase CheR
MSLIEPQDLEQFKSIILNSIGFVFDESKTDYIKKILQIRLRETGCGSFTNYLNIFTSPIKKYAEIKKLIEEIIVAETYFFRNQEQFLAFAEIALPERMQAKNNSKQIQVLSAGCASGEEAYTIACSIFDRIPDLETWDIQILGIDISTDLLQKAAIARYSEWSLRAIPEQSRQSHFKKEGKEYLLNESIKKMVIFEERNLIQIDPLFWRENKFDIIFCRNVLIYFSSEMIQKVIKNFAQSLDNGGFLFLGSVENLRGISNEFHLLHTHETFYYKRKSPSEIFQDTDVNLGEKSNTWFEQISLSSKRIATLVEGISDIPDKKKDFIEKIKTPPLVLKNNIYHSIVMDFLKEERFEEAMQVLQSLSKESKENIDAKLLVAVIHTNRGEIKEAEKVCHSILACDDLNAEAHYLFALCCEHTGRHTEAIKHNQTSLYLDPTFSMSHLHLGLLSKKIGDAETAKKELIQAMKYLEKEEVSRILLFGGGFNRIALMGFCKAELEMYGEKP